MPKKIPEETMRRGIPLVLDHLDEHPNLTAAYHAGPETPHHPVLAPAQKR